MRDGKWHVLHTDILFIKSRVAIPIDRQSLLFWLRGNLKTTLEVEKIKTAVVMCLGAKAAVMGRTLQLLVTTCLFSQLLNIPDRSFASDYGYDCMRTCPVSVCVWSLVGGGGGGGQGTVWLHSLYCLNLGCASLSKYQTHKLCLIFGACNLTCGKRTEHAMKLSCVEKKSCPKQLKIHSILVKSFSSLHFSLLSLCYTGHSGNWKIQRMVADIARNAGLSLVSNFVCRVTEGGILTEVVSLNQLVLGPTQDLTSRDDFEQVGAEEQASKSASGERLDYAVCMEWIL